MQKTRNKFDFYPTPMSIVDELVHRLNWPKHSPIWEPCSGDGRMVEALRKAGHTVYGTDIQNGQDFFDTVQPIAGSIVTNPPFNRIRDFIDHALGTLGVERLAIVCPERLWACGKGLDQFHKFEPIRFVNLSWREDYLGRGGAPDRALAISIWDMSEKQPCRFEVWDKTDQSTFFEQAA